MTRMGKANEKGLDEVSKAVLTAVFHAEDVTAKKVRIAPNYNVRSRLATVVLVILRPRNRIKVLHTIA